MFRIFEEYAKLTFILAMIIVGVIFYVSSIPHDPVPGIGFKYKAIIYHAGIFFFLCLFLMMALSKGIKKDWIFFAVLLSVFYGITDELHQHFVPGRSVSVGDFLIDSLGVFCALTVYLISLDERKNYSHKRALSQKQTQQQTQQQTSDHET